MREMLLWWRGMINSWRNLEHNQENTVLIQNVNKALLNIVLRKSVILAIILCLQCGIIAQNSKDSIIYYIENESLMAENQYDIRMLEFTESLFSELNINEIGAFYNEIESKIETVDNVLARTYLMEINCAFLSNSSKYVEAEECCKAVIDFGLTNGNLEIEAYGLHDLSYVYNHQGKYNEQIELLSRVISIWKDKDGSSEYLRYAVQQKAEGFSYLGMFDSSLYYMESAVDLEQEFGDSLTLCNVYEKYSRIYLEKGDYLSSYEYGQKGLIIARALNSKIRKQTNLMYVGFSSFYLGRYNQAIEHELEALSLYDGARNSSTSSVYIRLGRIYNSIEDYDQALRYLKEAESILLEIDYDVGLAKARTEIAFSQIRKGNYEDAFRNIEFSLNVFTDIKDDIYLSLAQRRMALLYDAQELCDLGIDVQDQAINILEKADKKGSLATAYLEKANIFSNCNRKIDAQNMALKGLHLQIENGDVKSISEAHFFLYNLYKEEMKESEALFHFEEYVKFYKQLTQSTEQQAIAEERARFKVEQIEKTNEIINARNQVLRGRNKLYAVIALSLLFIGVIGFLYFIKLRKLNSRIEGQKMKIEGQNSELLKLNNTKDRFFGIIAHDLRNPLAAFQGVGKQIRHYSKNNQLEKLTNLSEQIEILSDSINTLLDNLLNWSLLQTGEIPYVPKVLNLYDEVDEVCEIIEQLAIAKQIKLSVNVEEAITIFADSRAIQTVLRNIVTNAVKYTPELGSILIEAEQNESMVTILIKDTGVGMSQRQLDKLRDINKKSSPGTHGEKGSGLGLILAYDLVEMNKGNINFVSTEGCGTEVIISIPSKK